MTLTKIVLCPLTASFPRKSSRWSSKNLARTIVLSETYRRSSLGESSSLEKDPENRLLWRMNRKRLEAECLRDAVLAVSGDIDLAIGGMTIPAGLESDLEHVGEGTRRSVYIPAFRNSLPDAFTSFDFADPSLVVGARNISAVARQSLYLLNHPYMRAQGELTGPRIRMAAFLFGRVGTEFALRSVQ